MRASYLKSLMLFVGLVFLGATNAAAQTAQITGRLSDTANCLGVTQLNRKSETRTKASVFLRDKTTLTSCVFSATA